VDVNWWRQVFNLPICAKRKRQVANLPPRFCRRIRMAAPEGPNGDVIKIPDDGGTPERTPAEVKKEPEANKLFRMVMKLQASDLHLKVGQPPMMRLRGDLRRTEMRPLTQE